MNQLLIYGLVSYHDREIQRADHIGNRKEPRRRSSLLPFFPHKTYLAHAQPGHLHQTVFLFLGRIRVGDMILEPTAEDVGHVLRKVASSPFLVAITVIALVVKSQRVSSRCAGTGVGWCARILAPVTLYGHPRARLGRVPGRGGGSRVSRIRGPRRLAVCVDGGQVPALQRSLGQLR